eukprot:scaffold5039_cov255-Pinguiococcus_pyrenoidosus.AAC.8
MTRPKQLPVSLRLGVCSRQLESDANIAATSAHLRPESLTEVLGKDAKPRATVRPGRRLRRIICCVPHLLRHTPVAGAAPACDGLEGSRCPPHSQ